MGLDTCIIKPNENYHSLFFEILDLTFKEINIRTRKKSGFRCEIGFFGCGQTPRNPKNQKSNLNPKNQKSKPTYDNLFLGSNLWY